MAIEGPKINEATVESGPKPYIFETPPERLDPNVVPETRQEVLKALTERGWERAKEWFQKEIPDTVNPELVKERVYTTGFLKGADLMHDFDPVRFDREAQLTDSDWKRYRQNAQRERRQIEYAAALKKMDPARYEAEHPIQEEEIDNAFKSLSISRWVGDSIAQRDLSIPRALKALAPERFQTFRESKFFRERDWPEVKETLAWLEQHRSVDMPDTRTLELVTLRGQLQDMKPEGEPNFTITRAEQQVLRRELWSTQDHGYAPRFFHLANAASKLQIIG